MRGVTQRIWSSSSSAIRTRTPLGSRSRRAGTPRHQIGRSRARGDRERRVEIAQTPAQPGLIAPTRAVGSLCTPSRSAARATASASIGSDFPACARPWRALAMSLALRARRTRRARPRALQAPRPVPAVLNRPHPITIQRARPPQQHAEAVRVRPPPCARRAPRRGRWRAAGGGGAVTLGCAPAGSRSPRCAVVAIGGEGGWTGRCGKAGGLDARTALDHPRFPGVIQRSSPDRERTRARERPTLPPSPPIATSGPSGDRTPAGADASEATTAAPAASPSASQPPRPPR
jgi:hypothetical protein